MLSITVAIPTLNGAQRLPAVFAALDNQVIPPPLTWEVVVVDNGSHDETAAVVHTYQQLDSPSLPLRYVLEPQQGLAFARNRAIQVAQGELVAFIDDDNIPNPHWVAAAWEFAQTHPQAGAFGGQVHGQFETSPPEGFSRIAIFLAIVERGPTPARYSPKTGMLPPGAGLVVRRQAWLDTVPATLSLTGRSDRSMMAGEDLEALAYIQRAGWEVWYNPAMELDHKISAHRLEESYLRKLVWGIGLCRHRIRTLRHPRYQSSLMFPFYLANDLRKALIYIPQLLSLKISNPKHFPSCQGTLAQRLEAIYRLATLLGPFYFWQSALQKFLGRGATRHP